MRLYRKRKPTLKQRLFKLIVILLIAGIIADIYFPAQFSNFTNYANETYIATKDKIITKIQEQKEKREADREAEREREIERDKDNQIAKEIKKEKEKQKQAQIEKEQENIEREKNEKEKIAREIIEKELLEREIIEKEVLEKAAEWNKEDTDSDAVYTEDFKSSYENIVYQTSNERELKLNINRPTNNNKVPVIIYISGEDWKLDDNTNTAMYKELEKLSGDSIALVRLEYRDVDSGVFPKQLDDIRAAIKYVTDNSDKYGIDPERIGVVGGNTGGTLAQILGVTRYAHDETKNIKMVISLGAPTDIISLAQDVDGVNISKNEGIRRFDTANNSYARIVGFHTESWMGMDGVRKMIAKGDELRTNPYWEYVELAKTVSPYNLANENSAPIYVIHNINDKKIPVKQSIKFIGKLNSLNVENHLISTMTTTGNYNNAAILGTSLQWGLEKLDVKEKENI